MPQIFDNIDKDLLTALSQAMGLTERADFCVGYFNLRGWRRIDALVENWTGGDSHCCRLLVGMQQLPQDQLRSAISLVRTEEQIDQATAIARKRKLAEDFRDQLTIGIPTDADEKGLRRLAAQITAGKLVVKLFLRHQLHAKLYLLFRQDLLNPKIGYLGSSNLTLAGLSKQGELNVAWHTKCWQCFKVRPPSKSPKPEQTDTKYCIYDKRHNDYGYTEEWVRFLIDKFGDEKAYEDLLSGEGKPGG